MAKRKPIYRVRYQSEDKVYELYAEELDTTSMFGFVEVGSFLWGRRSSVIVDPSEQSLRHEFDGVKRTYIPYHCIRRIDLVEKGGTAKIVALPGGASAPVVPGVPPLAPGPIGPKKR